MNTKHRYLASSLQKLTCTLTLVVVLFLVVTVVPKTHAQNINSFIIDSFDAKYILGKDDKDVSTLDVKEKITAIFPDIDQNHGILRAIPMSYRDQDLGLDIKSVRNENGQDIRYSTSEENNNLVLKIGNPYEYVHGRQVYVIDYKMKNVIRFYDNHDEWYWNVNGTQWQQPMNNVSAHIEFDEDIYKSRKSEVRCYTGMQGSTASNCDIQGVDRQYKTISVSATDMSPGANLSFVVGFEKDTFKPDYEAARKENLRIIIALVVAVGLPLIILVVLIRRWQNIGRDERTESTIVPQYLPPEHLDPVLSDVLLDDRFQSSSVSATIVKMAVDKTLAIHVSGEGKKMEYELEFTRTPDRMTNIETEVL